MTTISYAGARVSLEQFEMFIKDNYTDIHPIFNKVNILKKYVDVDGDGYIDKNDLEVFLKRYQKMEYAKSQITRSIYSFRTDLQKYALFPTKKLGDKKAKEILREIRQALHDKKLTYNRFYQQLDKNGDGLISVDEFLRELNSIITLALPIRQKLFAYFDKTNIGMVDYKTFLSVLDPDR